MIGVGSTGDDIHVELVVESGRIINTQAADAENPLGAISSVGYVTLWGGEVSGPYGVWLHYNRSVSNKAMLTLVGAPKVKGSLADICLWDNEDTVNTIPFLDATGYTGEALEIEWRSPPGAGRWPGC